jgi:hypothetical protein
VPTKDQLRSIEWSATDSYHDADICPACKGIHPDSGCDTEAVKGHAADCWLSAALATPDTLPPVEVGDVVALDMEGYGLALTPVDADGDVLVVDFNGYEHTSQHTHYNYSAEAVTAVYRRIWQRGEE